MPRRSPRPRAAVPAPAPAATPVSLPANGPCPCGLPAPYGECCGAFHTGRAAAPTAERLMRSRYSAFAAGDTGYLLRSWSARTRPTTLQLDPEVRWTRLDVLGSTGGTAFHTEGTVEFRAHYRLAGGAGSAGEQHENSAFVREDVRWVYVGEAG